MELHFIESEIQPVESVIEALPQFYLLASLALYDFDCFAPSDLDGLIVFWMKVFTSLKSFVVNQVRAFYDKNFKNVLNFLILVTDIECISSNH